MLKQAEKEELVARCVLLIKEHGDIIGRSYSGRGGSFEATTLGFIFDDFQIKATTPNDPGSANPVHLELRFLEKKLGTFGPLVNAEVTGQAFLVDLDRSTQKVTHHYWNQGKDVVRALDAARKLMVLDDLASI